MINTKVNFYEVLKVSENATETEIRTSYKRIMRKHHPDIAPGPENERITRQASEAYAILSNATSRAKYDADLRYASPTQQTYSQPKYSTPKTSNPRYEAPVYSTGYTPPKIKFEKTAYTNVPFDSLRKNKVKKIRIFPSTFVMALLPVLLGGLGIIVSDSLEKWVSLASILLSFRVMAFYHPKKLISETPLAKSIGISVLVLAVSTALTVLLSNYYGAFVYPSAAVLVSFYSRRVVYYYLKSRTLVGTRSLFKNNIFGSPSAATFNVMTEEALDQFFNVPGVKIFRLNQSAFTHMVIFNRTVLFLKTVYLFSPTTFYRSGNDIISRDAFVDTTVAPEVYSFLKNVKKFAPSDAIIIPAILVTPHENFAGSSDVPRVHFVQTNNAAFELAKLLFEDSKESVVRQGFITEMDFASQQKVWL